MPVNPLVIQVAGFRAFRDVSEFTVRPLTLLYGRNQAGKSTLLRLLPLLADSIYGQAPGLDLSSAALLGATFKELGWLGPGPSGSPRLRVGLPAGPHLELQLTDDGGLVPNRVHIGAAEAPQFAVSWDGNPNRTPHEFHADYRGKSAGSPWSGPLHFESMLPRGLPPRAKKDLDRIRPALAPLERIQWLAASKSASGAAPRASRCCAPDGRDLAKALSEHKPLLEHASEWLRARDELGESVEVSKNSKGEHEFRLRRGGGESLPLYLAGEGMRWLLPVLLCSYWAQERISNSPTMLAIEEPEARLHPSLQEPLFERLIELSKAGIPVVLETHSVYILRCLQLALATRQLQPDDVALHWVSRGPDDQAASVRRIEVQRDGTLEGWEADSFEDEQKLSRRLFEARWETLGRT